MKNKLSIKIIIAVFFAGAFASCNKDLNRKPLNDLPSDAALKNYSGYQALAAKVYAADALSGNSGNGSSDMQGFDAGSSDFLRLYWNAQVLSTDEAICAWGDAELGTTEMHTFGWSAQTGDITYLYNRCFYIIDVCNDYIRESAPAILASKGIVGDSAKELRYFAAEARFIRAYQYWVLMDLFGSPTFVTETDPFGVVYYPPQKTSAQIFTYVESELKAIDGLLKPAKTNDYGRVDQSAEWALLARLYLNAQTYTGTPRYTDAITYANKVIAAGYSLHPKYQNLFLADNNLNNPEVIWSLNYDGTHSQIYGGTTFLVNSAVNGTMANVNIFGVTGGWGGNRATQNLPMLFGNYSGTSDSRALFSCPGASTTLANTDLGTFTDGLPVVKFKNITSTGATGAVTSADGTSCSIDFPVFRLAEQYLMYAEAVLRGGTGGDATTALSYLNLLRWRAYGQSYGPSDVGQLYPTDLNLQLVLDERGRELYWECFRRTDLIRYGQYTGSNYVWPWKGNSVVGVGVDAHFALFPIPGSVLATDPLAKQNPGY